MRIIYKLQQEDGWPPVEEERLWAVPLSDEVVRIANTPWFVRDVAVNDLVGVEKDSSGILRPTEKLSWGGFCAIRVIPSSGSSKFANLQEILDLFAPLGVVGEGLGQFGLVALAVPPGVDTVGVKRLLSKGFEAGWWDYEEACVGGSW
ncbi:DUF4265 domain-containing protein [Streptomyces niveus]|uniref:DUF4265 domain-containing protein n=1 Tax=Streptomyces niveus TaxID=193462 RepID=UPI00344A3E53